MERKQYIFTFFVPGEGFQVLELSGVTMGEAYAAFAEAYPAFTGVILYNVQFLGS